MKPFTRLFSLVVLLAVCASAGFGWGNITHVYIAKHLGPPYGQYAVNARYGALLPDAFNFMLDVNGAVLSNQSHFFPMEMMQAAHGWDQRAAAWGFLTHNNAWGADFTAHSHGMTYKDTGWVVYQGQVLAPAIVPQLAAIVKNGCAVPLSDDEATGFAMGLAPTFGHDLVETAVDILVRRCQDREIGRAMTVAATRRSRDIPALFARAYANDLVAATGMAPKDATALIIAAEADYQQQMIAYGQAFEAPEALTIEWLAGMNAVVAKMFIDAAGEQYGLPLNVTVDPAVVTQFITAAIAQVKPVYEPELRKTLGFVEYELDRQLRMHAPDCLRFPEDLAQTGTGIAAEPAASRLAQNSPNPFNPSTNINYTLVTAGEVSLKVYNTIGEEVTSLVSGVQSAGVHTVTWNASNLPSGVYIYRLEAGALTEVKRMILLK